jgi:hypothetical protein
LILRKISTIEIGDGFLLSRKPFLLPFLFIRRKKHFYLKSQASCFIECFSNIPHLTMSHQPITIIDPLAAIEIAVTRCRSLPDKAFATLANSGSPDQTMAPSSAEQALFRKLKGESTHEVESTNFIQFSSR